MKSRLLRKLVPLLAVAQLLGAAPLASAWAPVASASAHCAGMMDAADHSDDCPCCPEQAGSAACLSACVASAGLTPTLELPRAVTHSIRITTDAPLHRARLADPPVKPPPIA